MPSVSASRVCRIAVLLMSFLLTAGSKYRSGVDPVEKDKIT